MPEGAARGLGEGPGLEPARRHLSRRMAEPFADPQVAHMEWLQSIALPGGHMTQTFASPLRLNGQGFPIHLNPPALGEHTDEIKRRHAGRTEKELP